MSDYGFVKLYRSIVDWEWFDDEITLKVFIYFLATANFKDSRYKGHDIPRGSLVSGILATSKRLKISVRQYRTALTKLKTTHEVTIETTNQFSIISVTNYNNYQNAQSVETHEATNERQASDKRATTSLERKKERKKENKSDSLPESEFSREEALKISKDAVEIFDAWISLDGTIKHAFTRNLFNRIVKRLKKPLDDRKDELRRYESIPIAHITAFTRYSHKLCSPDYFVREKWAIDQFMNHSGLMVTSFYRFEYDEQQYLTNMGLKVFNENQIDDELEIFINKE